MTTRNAQNVDSLANGDLALVPTPSSALARQRKVQYIPVTLNILGAE